MKQNKGSRNRFTFIQSLDFDKRGKAVQWEKESLSKGWCWHNWIIIQEKKSEPQPLPHIIHFKKLDMDRLKQKG